MSDKQYKSAATLPMELKDKVIVVTGGSQGIGKTIGEHYFRAGAKVAIFARNEKTLAAAVKEIGEGSHRILGIPTDVTDLAQIKLSIAKVESTLGPIDVFHNNTGIHKGFGPFWVITPQEWEDDLNVNLTGSYLCARTIAPLMIARKKGIIINTLGGGVTNIPANMAAYSVSKTGLLRLTEIMAKELYEYDVAVFGLFPGLINTPGNQAKAARPEVEKYMKLADMLKNNAQSADPAGEVSVKLATGKYNTLSGQAFHQSDNLDSKIAGIGESK